MLFTGDIEGAQPQKFRLKHKRHEYLKSPYHSSVERTTFTDSFKKIRVPHDIYYVPDIAPKITNVPAPVCNDVDPFGVSIRKEKFRDSDGKKFQQSNTVESIGDDNVKQRSRQESQSSIKLMQVPSDDARRTNQAQQQPQQQEPKDEQRQSRNNFHNNSDASGYNNGTKLRRSQSNFMPQVQDSIDKLKYEVDNRKNMPTVESESPIQIKKALHNFYGVTPPASRTNSYYNNFELKRQDTDQERKLTDSYYQNITKDALQKAQQDTKFNKAMKNFFGSTVTEPAKPQLNLNQSYAHPQQAYPITSPTYAPSNLLSDQKKIDHSFGGYGHSQHFKPNLNLNSRPELPFTLDPLTHQKIYKTGVKNQNNYSVQLGTKPENDYFYARSNSPTSKYY